MKESLEIKLIETNEPTFWERIMQWLNADDSQPRRPGQQVPKTGTNTEILLSQTQKMRLKDAVESPGERPSETGFLRRSESQDNSHLII